MRGLRVFALLFTLISSSGTPAADSTPPHVNLLKRFIAAFNAQDSSAMADCVADDIEWMSIAGEQVVLEVRGKDNLKASMDDYFASCPSCRSALSGVASTADRVSAIESASWQGSGGPQSQQSISVYEFSEGLISRVYYFPAEN